MISLRELARQNKVSVSTVSRALRDDPSVREDTKRKIQAAAEKLNYMPNRLVEGVFTGRTRLIALIASEVSFDPISRLISTVVDEINSRGWGCVIYNTHGSEEREPETIHQAISLRVSGMIISSVNYKAGERYYWELGKYKIPYVLSSEYAPEVTVPHVHCDDFTGGLEVIDYLYSLGHRNIANLSGPESTWDTGLRHKGYFSGMAKYGQTVRPGWVVSTDWSSQDAEAKACQMLRDHPEITAIFCANDRIAMGACLAIRKAGLNVPADISVVGVGDSVACTYHTPTLTTMDQNLPLIAKRCVDTLFTVMEMSSDSPLPRNLLDIMVPANLIVRESTGPVRSV